MEDWRQCESIAQHTEENMNDLFVLYEYYLLGSNPARSLYDELVERFANEDPNEVMIRFKKFIRLYRDDIYESQNPVIYSFYYLRWTMYWRSIVLTALYEQYPEYDEFLKVFRRYYYVSWIAGHTLSKVKQTSFNIIGWLKEKVPVDIIANHLEISLQGGAMSRAIDNLNGDMYTEAWCKPLLFMIEYNQQEHPVFYSMGNHNIQTEHILPRGYLKNDDWAYIQQVADVDEWIDSGANLTLLSGAKNISASYDRFELKIKAYDGTGNHNDKDDKITSFAITQKIVYDYHAGRYGKEWSIDAINARWVWFCEQVERLLDIDLGKNKTNLLRPFDKEVPLSGESSVA